MCAFELACAFHVLYTYSQLIVRLLHKTCTANRSRRSFRARGRTQSPDSHYEAMLLEVIETIR